MGERKQLIRVGILLICILVGWVLYVSSKQLQRNQRIEDEVAALQAEADKIRRENETLSEKIGYFSSPDFREQEAKEKLGMKKVDESVVVIKSRPIGEGVSGTEKEQEKTVRNEYLTNMPNYKKWWGLFFQQT